MPHLVTVLRWSSAEDHQAFLDALPILAARNHLGGGCIEDDLAAHFRRLVAELYPPPVATGD